MSTEIDPRDATVAWFQAEALTVLASVREQVLDELGIDDFEFSPINVDSAYADEEYDAALDFAIYVKDDPDKTGWDVRIHMPYGPNVDDVEGPCWGVGFGSSHFPEGRIGPGGTMYNYTPEVWTGDREELKRRLAYLSENDSEFAYALVQFIRGES